jgi:hypothetical protein
LDGQRTGVWFSTGKIIDTFHIIMICSAACSFSYIIEISFPGLKLPECEADESNASTADIKYAWSYAALLHTLSWHCA